jgi:hypothetical protein
VLPPCPRTSQVSLWLIMHCCGKAPRPLRPHRHAMQGEKKFAMITGVADDATFNSLPSWMQTPDNQDHCYIGAPATRSRQRLALSSTADDGLERLVAVTLPDVSRDFVPCSAPALTIEQQRSCSLPWSFSCGLRQARSMHRSAARYVPGHFSLPTCAFKHALCCAADFTRPAADIAAQVSAALAMLAKCAVPLLIAWRMPKACSDPAHCHYRTEACKLPELFDCRSMHTARSSALRAS